MVQLLTLCNREQARRTSGETGRRDRQLFSCDDHLCSIVPTEDEVYFVVAEFDGYVSKRWGR